MCRKHVRQFFVSREHLAPGSHRKGKVEAVAKAVIEAVRNCKSRHEQILRGNSGKISLGHVSNCRLRFDEGPSALVNRLAGDVAELCPEDVGTTKRISCRE
jgi:hypothetical protein